MQSTIRPEDSATAWFSVLELARRLGDVDRAAEALRELERLGVRVEFGRPAPLPEARPAPEAAR